MENSFVDKIVDFILVGDSRVDFGFTVIDGAIKNTRMVLKPIIQDETTIVIEADDPLHLFLAPSVLVLGCSNMSEDKDAAMDNFWDNIRLFYQDMQDEPLKVLKEKFFRAGFAELADRPGHFTKRFIANREDMRFFPFDPDQAKVSFAQVSINHAGNGGSVEEKLLELPISYREILGFGKNRQRLEH